MPLKTRIHAKIDAELIGAPDIGTSYWKNNAAAVVSTLEDGTTSGKANRVLADTRTIAASANEDLDLAGTLEDPIGGPAVFAKVKAIMIKAASGNTNNVVVKPATSNGFLGPFGAAAHTISIPPGGVFLASAPAAGWTVTAGTGDLINVANSGAGTSVSYDLFVLGTSA
jgi:hypothetical protein